MATSNHENSATSESYLVGLGRRVRRLRARRGMSRRILAESSQVSERYLADLESGKGNISVLRLRQIAHAMSVPIEDLVVECEPDSVDYGFILNYIRRADAKALATLAAELRQKKQEMPRIVALIGLRGAGKSTIGKALAESLGRPFIELVASIEAQAGMKVDEIFSLGGQAMYRRYEMQCLEQIITEDKYVVLATGGSIVSESASYERLLGAAVTVWLTATAQEHMQRVIAQGDHRPMAGQVRAMDDLKRILREREHLYLRADYVVETTDKTIERSLTEVLELPKVAALKDAKEVA